MTVPHVTGIRWVDGLGYATLIVGIVVAFVAKVLLPLWRGVKGLVHGVDRVVEVLPAIPVLVEIAEQFKPNGGNSLKDALIRIEGSLTENRDQITEQGGKLDALHKYAHDTRHEQANDIQKLVLSDRVLSSKLDDIAAKAAEVAADLAASHQRADAVHDSAEGAAADAASRSPDEATDG